MRSKNAGIQTTDLLLRAMRSAPDGLTLQDYARLLGKSLRVVKDASCLLSRGQKAVFVNLSYTVYWTAKEHQATLDARAQAWRAMRARELKQSKRRWENDRRARERAKRPVRERTAQRYQWPDESSYAPPGPRIRSVWELAGVMACL